MNTLKNSTEIPKTGIVARAFVLRQKDQTGQQTVTEFPIYPKEMKVDVGMYAPYSIKEQIEKEMEFLGKIGAAFETVGSLYQYGFHEMASDLTEGLLRTEKSDYEGARLLYMLSCNSLKNTD